MTPPHGTQITPPVRFDAEGLPLRSRRAHLVVGFCVLSGVWALLVMAARVLLGWRWGR